MKTSQRILSTVVTVLVAAMPAWADLPFDVSGYFKNFSIAMDQPHPENVSEALDQPLMGAVNNRLRLVLSARPYDDISLKLAYDISPRIQDQMLFYQPVYDIGIATSAYRAYDFDARLYPKEGDPVRSFALFHNLDRAVVTISNPGADVYIGRQAIAWGQARAVNPTDVLAPFAFDELDVEDRRGVDAIRVRVPMGFMSEVDFGAVFGDEFDADNSAAFVRTKFYYRQNDISLLAVAFRENLMLGFDLARSIGGAGFWVEAAHVFAKAFESDAPDRDEDYFRASIGGDYSLRDGTYLFGEYHYNGAGSGNEEDYLIRMDRTAYREGSVYLMGEHYFVPGASHQVTPLIVVTGQALVNLGDQSLLLAPHAEYNIAENVYLSGGAYLGVGESPEVDLTPFTGPFYTLRSEFGSYADSYYVSFRFYF